MFLELAARFTGEYEDQEVYTTLNLDISKTAFLLVDCTYDEPASGVGKVIGQIIAPTLAAIRSVGMKAVFVYGGDHNDPHSINLELHGTRRGRIREQAPWPLPMPQWFPGVEPQATDPILVKCGQNAF